MAKQFSVAEQWQRIIDRPLTSGGINAEIDRDAVTRMQDNAEEMAERDGGYVFIFGDGSSLWEKRKDDWRAGDDYVRCPECKEWAVAKAGGCPECVVKAVLEGPAVIGRARLVISK
jgi:hypothetical protein